MNARECFRSFIIPRGLLRLILHVPIYWPDFSDTINPAANRRLCMAIQNAPEVRKSVRLLLNGLSSLCLLIFDPGGGGGRGATLRSIIRGEAPHARRFKPLPFNILIFTCTSFIYLERKFCTPFLQLNDKPKPQNILHLSPRPLRAYRSLVRLEAEHDSKSSR